MPTASTWYNFIWIPHRVGGEYGAANTDNCNYGILVLFYMTSNSDVWFTVHLTNNTIQAPQQHNNNTWRGIQNVLTSTSTTDSLSAAQGKVLNDKIERCTPKYTNVGFTNITANTSWQTVLNNWTAPANGWLCVYLSYNVANGNPSAYIGTDGNQAQLAPRANGNGARDFSLVGPVFKGHKYSVGCVACKPTQITFTQIT